MKGCRFIIFSIVTLMFCLNAITAIPASAANEQWANPQHPHRFWNSRDPNPMVMLVDGVLVRPISFAATLLGGAFYVVTLPFSASGGNAGQAWDQMVKAPARSTFARPLGVFYVDFEENEKESGAPQPRSAGIMDSSNTTTSHAGPHVSEESLTSN